MVRYTINSFILSTFHLFACTGDKPEHWNLTEKDHGKVKSYMETAAASIWEAGFQNDGVLKSMVAVDLKMGRNYLQFLADMYMREVIYHKVANNRDFKLEAGWKNENEHIASLFNMKAVKLKIDGGKGNSKGINTPGALVCGAIKSYFGRVAPKLQLNATNKIKGDLKTAAHHVLSTTAFVANLHTKQCPFQYDAGIFSLLYAIEYTLFVMRSYVMIFQSSHLMDWWRRKTPMQMMMTTMTMRMRMMMTREAVRKRLRR